MAEVTTDPQLYSDTYPFWSTTHPALLLDRPQLEADLATVCRDFNLSFNALRTNKVHHNCYDVCLELKSLSLLECAYINLLITQSSGLNVVDHRIHFVPQKLQRAGIATAMNRALYYQYKRLGIDRITIQASGQAGGYVWALYGFRCYEEHQVLRIVDKFDDWLNTGSRTLSPHDVARIEAIRKVTRNLVWDQNGGLPMNLLANLSCGEDLLVGTNWSGILDLSRQEEVFVLEQYLLRDTLQ